jgi:hypothetical protein
MADMWINQSGTAIPLGFKAIRVNGIAVSLDEDHIARNGGGAAVVTPPAPVTRVSLNGKQGTYWPSLTADNVGLINGTNLSTGPTGDVSVTTGGTYENLDIAGFMLIRTSDPVVIRNCRIRGWDKPFSGSNSNTALVNCDNGLVSNVIIEDCELIPDYPSSYVNGIIGHHYTARRNHIRNVVDFFEVRNAANPSGPVNVNIWANYCHDFAYFTPDPAGGGRPNTHNDAIQYNFGQYLDLTGNVLIGNGSPNAGTPPYGIGTGSGANTADGPDSVGRGINVTGGTGQNASDFVVNKNRFDNFMVAISIPGATPSVSGSITITNNQFGPNMPTINTSSSSQPQHYQIQIGVNVDVVGFPSGADLSNTYDTTNGNIYQSTGNPAIIRRGSF